MTLNNQHQIADSAKIHIPLDLICVIDVSGSMCGAKIELVKKSLTYLLDVLTEQDRLSLITFAQNVNFVSPFLFVNEKNKLKQKCMIKEIEASGGTNIEAGMCCALEIIKQRKTKNPISCVFLLSDGVDNYPKTANRVRNLIENSTETFPIHSFGYGSEHDSLEMMNISSFSGGNYYYVQAFEKIDEFFTLSLGGLFTIALKEACLRVAVIEQPNLNPVISKQFDKDCWSCVKENKEYEVKMSYLHSGVSKCYVFEVEFNKIEKNLIDQEKSTILLKGNLIAKTMNGKEFVKTIEMPLVFLNPDEEISKDYNQHVKIHHFRVITAETIRKTRFMISDENKYSEAQNILKSLIETLEFSNEKDDAIIRRLIIDCKNLVQHANPQSFQSHGKKVFDSGDFYHSKMKETCDFGLYSSPEQLELVKKLQEKKTKENIEKI